MHSDPTIELVSLALDAALMRETAIANNIANSNSQGYRTMAVNFEEQLRGIHSLDELATVKPVYQQCEERAPLDEQIALNVQNMTHYRALIKGLNQKLSLMKLALQGNNPS
jgi:flagellar basal-body rod protein FlgB